VVHAGNDTYSAHRRLAAHACTLGGVSLAAIEFLLTQPCAGAVSILSEAFDFALESQNIGLWFGITACRQAQGPPDRVRQQQR
jgi:hypothetical protein